MISFDSLIILYLATIILILKPGPYILAYTSLALEGRWKSILIFWCGSVTGGTIVYTALLSGFNLLPTGFGMVFIFIKALAAMLFITIGIKGLGENIADYKAQTKIRKEKIMEQGFIKTIFAGFFLTMSNPYNVVYILAAIPTIVNKTSFSIADIIAIRGTVIAADITTISLYCLLLFFVRGFFNDSVLRMIKIGASVLMILAGLYIFANMMMQWDLYHTGLLSEKL